MGKQMGLIVNTELCIGCFACEVACKQEHDLPEGKNGIKVKTLGPYEIDSKLAMDIFLIATEECDLCAERTASGKRPFCAQICPTQALNLHTDEEILKLLRSEDRYQLCKIRDVTLSQ